MTNEQLFIMLFAALAVAAMLYLNVQKITRRIDESTANPDFSYYGEFCEEIVKKLEELKMNEPAEGKSAEENNEFLSGLVRELRYIESMNANAKSAEIWESKLFTILDRLDRYLSENFLNGEKVANAVRDELQSKFGEIIKKRK